MAFQVVVASIRAESERIRCFELQMADGSPTPRYAPGSSMTLALPDGMLRTYSLIDSGAAPTALRIAVLRQEAGRGGSRYLHDQVRKGDRLQVNGFSSSFDLRPGPAAHILIAGGIGITPILSLAQHFLETGQAFQLHYCVPDRATAAFAAELQSGPLAAHVSLYCSRSDGRMNIAGLVSAAAPGSQIFCCGPDAMMSELAKGTAHWPAGRVHFDRFETDTDAAARSAFGGAVGGHTEAAFRIKLASTGQEIEVGPDQSALTALRAHGIKVDSQCGQGHCGSCLTPVLEGLPDHRDRVLTDAEKAENDLMALCCSRSKSALLVLDL